MAEYPQHFGNYLLLEHLGTGGMSHVDLARRAVADGAYVRFVVIKRIHAKNEESSKHVQMFQDEARIHSELHHTNIAQLYDFGQQDDSFYLVMEYVPGMDLRSVQRSLLHRHRKRIPLRISLSLIAEVLEGLSYAHAAVDTLGRPMNVVHRDVNPRNVMLSVRGDVKLIDFGVAKASDKIDTTRTNALKGKIAYMAPEQMDQSPIDGRADIFAVGLMFQEFINGSSPFSGLNEIQIMKCVLDGRLGELNPKGHPEPELLVAIRDRALATDPDDRYQEAAHFLRDLEQALDPLGGRATRVELAKFIRQVDPVVVERIERRLESYQAGVRPDAHLTDTTSESILLDASMSKTVRDLEDGAGDAPKGRMLSAALVGALGMLLLLGVVGGVFYLQKGGESKEESLVEGVGGADPAAPTLSETELTNQGSALPQSDASKATGGKENRERDAPGVGPSVSTTVEPVSQEPDISGVTPKAGSADPTEAASLPTAEQAGKAEEATIGIPVEVSEPVQFEEPVVEEAPKPVRKRLLFITTVPSNLVVEMDGKSLGVSPVKPKVAIGLHTIRVTDPKTGKSKEIEYDFKLRGKNSLTISLRD